MASSSSTLQGFIAQNPLIVFARCALQLILLQEGRPDDARVEFERLAEGEFRLVQRDWNWLSSMFVLADVCADLGEAECAEILYRLLLPYASRNAMLGNVYTYGSVAFALGRLAAVLGRVDEGQALHQRECSLFPRPFREGREADHVGEKDGDLPAFRLHPNSPLTGMRQRSIAELAFDDSEAKGRVQNLNRGSGAPDFGWGNGRFGSRAVGRGASNDRL